MFDEILYFCPSYPSRIPQRSNGKKKLLDLCLVAGPLLEKIRHSCTVGGPVAEDKCAVSLISLRVSFAFEGGEGESEVALPEYGGC